MQTWESFSSRFFYIPLKMSMIERLPWGIATIYFIGKTMTITVNDKPKEVPEGCTVEALCAIVGIPADSPVAVAVGMDVVERERWKTTELKENEKVTIIGAVCGG